MYDKTIDSAKIISERLVKALQAVDISQTELASRTGYTRVYINQMVRGSRGDYTNAKALYKVSSALGINAQWLMHGEGDMFSVALGYNKGQCFDLDKNLAVSVFTNEQITIDENNNLQWGKPVNTAFIPNQILEPQIKELKALVVEEQNMQPSLFENDLAILDPSKTKIQDGRVYAFMYEGKISFRRIIVNLDGSYAFIAEYPMKTSMNVPVTDLDKFCLLGMVLCKISFTI